MADISAVAATALAGSGAVSPLRALVASPLAGVNAGLGGGLAVTLPFSAALNQQVTASVANGESELTRLAQTGIGFQAGGAFSGAALGVDLASEFTAPTGGATLDLANLSRNIALNQTLSLFASPLSNTGKGLQGLPGLQLLDALSRGGSGTNQQVAALSQFLLVSSLLE